MAQPVNEALLEQLNKNIEQLLKALTQPITAQAELFTALAKAQGEMRIARSLKENRYYKVMFEDFESVVEASRPALTKYGLSVMHIPMVNDDGSASLKCILAHSSGQYLESTMRVLPTSNDPQALGSCFAYLKRQSYASICGVAAQSEDDDGEIAMAESRITEEKGTSLNHKYNPREQSSDTITKEQLEEVEYELTEYPDIGAQILKGLRILSLADIPKSKYRDCINRIRLIKAERNGIKR